MSDHDKKLLVYLGALIILAAAYFLVARPYLDKIDQQSFERSQLEGELRDKREAVENKEMYEQGILESAEKIQAIMDEFPEDNADEKSIMFASHAEADVPVWFNQMKFAEETQNLINGQNEESASDVEQAQLEENIEAAEGEGGPANNPDTGVSEAAPAEDAGGRSTGIGDLIWRDTELGLSFETQYDGFKNLLAYIRDYEDRIVIKEIDITYNKLSGLVTGNIVLSQYAILGPGRVLPDTITDVKELGTDNVFTNVNNGGSILDLLADMYQDFLSKLLGDLPEDTLDELGTDYFVKVNAVTDNTSGKTIGRADDSSEATYITSTSNSTEDVTFKVSGSGGDYSVYYKIGDTDFTDSISKDADGKLYLRIVSTIRSGDSDESAVSLHVLNGSDIPVVVNIEGDDPDDPRVSVTEKTGSVTVNGGR